VCEELTYDSIADSEKNLWSVMLMTGYVSKAQIPHILDIFKKAARPGAVKIVDPAMADNGKLYAGCTKEFAAAMKDLCAKADIICPNMTEASFLLDIPYRTEYDEAYDAAVAQTDQDQRIADFKKAQQILTQEAASVYIEDISYNLVYSKKFTGFAGYPLYATDFAAISPAE